MSQFDEIKATFWSDDPYGVQAPLTDEMVAEAERVLQVRLPSTLLELLRVQNGGMVAEEWNAFATREPTSWAHDHVPLTDLAGIGRADDALSLLESPYLTQEWGLPEAVVLLSGDGHTWIALDYRVCGPTGEPSVTWLDAELQEESSLAANFRSFVEGLAPERDFPVDVGDERPAQDDK